MKAMLLALALTTSNAAFADTIAENQSGGVVAAAGPFYLGQSFTVMGTGKFDTVAANFYDRVGTAAAPGALYLYSTAFTGTESQLGSGTGFLGTTIGSGGIYSFVSALTLNGGQQYFAYSDALSPAIEFAPSDVYSGGEAYQADSASQAFEGIPTVDLQFRVTANSVPAAAVPEPATWAMMIVGFGMIGAGLRYRKRRTVLRYI